jgi:uncharacterized protein
MSYLKFNLTLTQIGLILSFTVWIFSIMILLGDVSGTKGSDRVTIHDLLPFDPSTQQTATDTGSQALNNISNSSAQTDMISSTIQPQNGSNTNMLDMTEHIISVTGSGVLPVKPDLVTISLGIITSKDSEEASLEANSATFHSVMDFLTKYGINNKVQSNNISAVNTSSVSTNALSIKQANLSKYTVVRSIVISTSNISGMPSWITELGKLGVNSLDKIQFTLTDENMDKERINVMEKAMGDAWTKARDAAILLGVKVVGVKSLTIDNFAIHEDLPYPKGLSPISISWWFQDFTPSVNLDMNISQSFLFRDMN